MGQRTRSRTYSQMSDQDSKREPSNASIKKESLNMQLPNPCTLIAGSLLIVLALTQYFAIRSENAVLVVQISDLQQQLRNAESEIIAKRDERAGIPDDMACLKENIRLENQKNSLIQINNELQKAIKEKKECVPDGKGKDNNNPAVKKIQEVYEKLLKTCETKLESCSKNEA